MPNPSGVRLGAYTQCHENSKGGIQYANLKPTHAQFARAARTARRGHSRDLGSESEQVILVLFGTGLRYRSSLQTTSVKIGGVDGQVFYAGAQGDWAGLDQVNLRLPRTLVGRGEVEVTLLVDGRAANPVRISIK